MVLKPFRKKANCTTAICLEGQCTKFELLGAMQRMKGSIPLGHEAGKYERRPHANTPKGVPLSVFPCKLDLPLHQTAEDNILLIFQEDNP